MASGSAVVERFDFGDKGPEFKSPIFYYIFYSQSLNIITMNTADMLHINLLVDIYSSCELYSSRLVLGIHNIVF